MIAPSINLGRRGRIAIKIAGFVVLGLVAFVFAIQATFNYDRVVQRYFVDALAASYDVTVSKVERGIMPGAFTMERVRIQARPTKADEVPPVMILDKVEADVGVLALIGGKIAVEFEAQIGGGTLTGDVAFPLAGGAFKLTASGHAIKGDMIPQLRTAIGGLPLLGKLDLGISVDVGNDWRKATGYVTLGCPKGCTIGDGQTKFKPPVKSQRSAAMMGEGIEWGRVDIDKLDAKAEFKAGRFTVTKWDLQSRDAELHVDLDVKLAKKFRDLEFTVGCFRYKALPALIERDGKTASAIAMVGGILGPDDLFHVKLEGTWATVKAKSKVCSADAAADVADGPGKQSDRSGPALTVVPPDTAHVETGTQPGADIQVPAAPIDAAPLHDAASGSGGSGSGTAVPGAPPGTVGPAPGSAMQGASGAIGGSGVDQQQQPPPPPPPPLPPPDQPIGPPASERGNPDDPLPPEPPPPPPRENE